MLFAGDRGTPAEGWKFHISAHPHNAEAIAEVVLPVLTKRQVWHKYLELHTLGTRTGNAVGKFIAYYPISPKDAHDVAAALSSVLASPGVRNLKGPVIQKEKRFGNTGFLYTRYGSFQYEYIKGPPDTGTCSYDSRRGKRNYHVGHVRPSWINALQDDHSEIKFPIYDARRVLRGLPESKEVWVD